MKGRKLEDAQDAATQAFSSGVANGISNASKAMLPALNEAMAQSVWAWPNVTIRKNTSEVSAPRDIIDTVNLRDSSDVTHNLSGTGGTITATYTAPYAAITHYGGMIRPYGRKTGDTFVLPARPWISSMLTGKNGIEQFKVLDYVDKAVKISWSNRYKSSA